MWWWQGASGQWYVHSILPFSTSTSFDNANYIFVRREFDGRRTGLYIGQSDKFYQRLPDHEKVEDARRLGVNELHVHLLAASEADRFHIETDLRNGHRTPLNEQGTPYANSLFGSLAPNHPLAPSSFGGLLAALGGDPYRR
jgi:hypothetical protein